DAGVAHQPAPFGALQRAAAKNPAKVLLAERQEPIEPGDEKRILLGLRSRFRCLLPVSRQSSRLKFHKGGSRCAAVPRANVLTDVAAKIGRASCRERVWGWVGDV